MRDRISRRNFLRTVGVGGLVLLNPPRLLSSQTRGGNVVLRWNDAFLQGVRESKLGPPMVSRALAVAHTCIFDAWAAYDRLALGTRVGGALRRPARERSLINKQTAISFAASVTLPVSIIARKASTCRELIRAISAPHPVHNISACGRCHY